MIRLFVNMQIILSYSAGPQPNIDQITNIEPYFFFIHTLDAYDLYSRLSDTGPQQLHLIKAYASSKSCNPKYLLQIGLISSDGPRSNPEVATYALNTCLSSLLDSQSPDYGSVAQIMRKLISLNAVYKADTDDDAIYGMYRQAYRVMVGLKEGEYPIEEGKWLAMTAWNRAALPVRMGPLSAAMKWMNIGLELAGKVQGMQTYRSCMEDFIASFKQKYNATNSS